MATVLSIATARYDFSAGSYGTGAGELIDISGNGNNGTFNTAKTVSTGWFGHCVNFSADTSTLIKSGGFGFTAVSVLALLKFNAIEAGNIVAEDDTTHSVPGWYLGTKLDSGKLALNGYAFYANDNARQTTTAELGHLLTGLWYVVGMTVQSGLIYLYINGNEPYYGTTLHSGTGSGNLKTRSLDCYIGYGLNANTYGNYTINYVAIWNSALSGTNIKTATEEIWDLWARWKYLKTGKIR